MSKYLVLFLFLACAMQLKAQIEAPDLLCIRNDSLFWELPNVSCGTLQGFDIYVSDDAGGPFSLLTQIVDVTQTVYHYSNPGNLVAYFYMESVADCPGETPLQSDVLDNQKPPTIPIRAVSIENGQLEITWDVVNEPDIIGYIIYKVTASGTVAIDTLLGNSFIDPTADITNVVETYYVNALDRCGEISFFDEPHNTMLLSHTINTCDQSVLLSWNAYNSWPGGVERYIVLVDTNGTGFVAVDTLDGDVLSYTLTNVDKEADYHVFIQAQTANGSIHSNSVESNFQPDVVAGVSPFELLNVDILSPTSLKLYWYWEGDFNIGSLNLRYISSNRTDTTILSLNPVIEGNLYTYILQGVETSEQIYCVLEVQNNCELFFRSNGMFSIKIEGTTSNNTASLQWMHNNASSDGLDLIRVDDSSTIYLGFFPQGQNATQDVWDGSRFQYCYQLIDTLENSFSNDVLVQHSNIICLSEALEVYVPNAFAPNGINRQFLAYFSNSSIIEAYEMKVFNRLGDELFQTNNFLLGWNGYVNEHLCNPGVYAYTLRISTVTGEEIQRSGQINLID